MRRERGKKKKKICAFCVDKVEKVDYKDVSRLRKFITERGKILPRRISGNCAGHQRQLTVAIKRPGMWRYCHSPVTSRKEGGQRASFLFPGANRRKNICGVEIESETEGGD